MNKTTTLVILGFLFSSTLAFAAKNDWAEGTKGKHDGATRDYYNRGGSLKWNKFMGDWADADGKAHGNKPFATVKFSRTNKPRAIQWDVSKLTQAWLSGKHQNQGFFIRIVSGSGPKLFYSREHTQKAQRPQLVIEHAGGTTTLEPEADTHLSKSTYQAQGNQTTLRTGPILIRFPLSKLKGKTIKKATLKLYMHKEYGGTVTIGVFRCQQGEAVASGKPLAGLAANYKDDVGIDKHPDVIFADRFESTGWKQGWSSASGKFSIVSTDSSKGFKPLKGKALRAQIAKGALHALSLNYDFKKKIGSEPEEIYFRYYLRLANDWNQTVQGGKMPGISGTYGRAGWGGRKSNGSNGWSSRGSFSLTIPKGNNPLGGLTPLGNYVYYADMKGSYGDVWVWSKGYGGYVGTNQWVCVEQYLKLNTPGKPNGIIKSWIDGRPAFDKRDIKFRTVNSLKIERIWMNVYHGGKTASPYDQHFYIDNVVIAKKYIGPISSLLNAPPPKEHTPEKPMPEKPKPEPPPTPEKPAPDAGPQPEPTPKPEPSGPEPTPGETQNPQDSANPDPGAPEPPSVEATVQDTVTPQPEGHAQDNTAPSQRDTGNGGDTGAQTGCGCSTEQGAGGGLLWFALCLLAFILRKRQNSSSSAA